MGQDPPSISKIEIGLSPPTSQNVFSAVHIQQNLYILSELSCFMCLFFNKFNEKSSWPNKRKRSAACGCVFFPLLFNSVIWAKSLETGWGWNNSKELGGCSQAKNCAPKTKKPVKFLAWLLSCFSLHTQTHSLCPRGISFDLSQTAQRHRHYGESHRVADWKDFWSRLSMSGTA